MPKDRLTQQAEEIAKRLEAEHLTLEAELQKIKARQVEIEAQLVTKKGVSAQLSAFEEARRGERICPDCWIKHHIRSPLVTDSGTPTDDFFKCPRCSYFYSEPAI